MGTGQFRSGRGHADAGSWYWISRDSELETIDSAWCSPLGSEEPLKFEPCGGDGHFEVRAYMARRS